MEVRSRAEGKLCGLCRLRCAGEHSSFYNYVKNYVLATRRYPHISCACSVKSCQMDNELNARVGTYCSLITMLYYFSATTANDPKV